MNVYIYCADIYCEACGEAIRTDLTAQGKAPANPNDEHTYDSDNFPKGPYPDGGGESDSPQHCGSGEGCLDPTIIDGKKYGKFLENDLTCDGVKYIKEELNPVIWFWASHYRKAGYEI